MQPGLGFGTEVLGVLKKWGRSVCDAEQGRLFVEPNGAGTQGFAQPAAHRPVRWTRENARCARLEKSPSLGG